MYNISKVIWMIKIMYVNKQGLMKDRLKPIELLFVNVSLFITNDK